MKRRLLNILTLLSLVLCVAVVALWVRGYWASTAVVRRWGVVEDDQVRNFTYDLTSAKGGVVFHYSKVHVPVAALSASELEQFVSERVRPGPVYRGSSFRGEAWDPYTVWPSVQYRLGFLLIDTRRPSGAGTEHMVYLVFPHWAAASLLAVLPVSWLLTAPRRRRTRRRAAGLCPACGYDLTGNVSGVCPECGRSLA